MVLSICRPYVISNRERSLRTFLWLNDQARPFNTFGERLDDKFLDMGMKGE